MAVIFLSHSSKDKKKVRRLAGDIRQLGHTVWFDEWEIRVGDCIVTRIEGAIAEADFVVVVLSPHAVASEWVGREWKAKYWDEIQQRRTMVLPVLLGDCEPPALLKTKRYANCGKNYAVGLAELMEAIGAAKDGLDQFEPLPAPTPPVEAGAAPGPKLEPAEENALLDWERRGSERFDWLLANEPPEELPDRYQHGTWSVTHGLSGPFETPSDRKFQEMLVRSEIHESGWPMWIILHDRGDQPYPTDDAMECWLKRSVFKAPVTSDFWRATPSGLLHLKRGYNADLRVSMPDEAALPQPGTALFHTDPMWQVGEVLLHAERLAQQLAEVPLQVGLRFRWEGLRGRSLAIAPGRGGVFIPRRVASQAAVSSLTVSLLSSEIRPKLAETVQAITRPLYRIFDFHEPELKQIVEELRRVLEVDARMPDGTVPRDERPF